MLAEALSNWRTEALFDDRGLAAIRNTLVMAVLSVACSALVGVPLAFLLTRYTFPGRRALAALAYLPFALPPLVGVVSFYYLIGPDGFITRFINEILGFKEWSIKGPGAILLIHTYSFYVFFYAMVSAALDGMDSSQLEAARTLGASRTRVFFRILVPMLTPALLGASLLTFMSSGASFSAPLYFGNDFPMLSVRIFAARNDFHNAEALTLTVALAAVSLLGVLLFRSRKRHGGTASKGVPRAVKSPVGRVLAGALAVTAMAVLLVPHLTVLWLSLVDHRLWGPEILPTVFTLGNYLAVFRDPQVFTPIRNSLWMSGVAALGCLAVGMPAAYLIARKRPGGRWVNLLVMVPWALPGTVVAMNLIAGFNDLPLSRQALVWMLPLAYFVRSIPLFTRMASAAIEPFDARLIEAGQTLGASRMYCLRRIVLPLLAPAVAAGAALVFATSLGEFVASVLLYLPANKPISIQINEWVRGSMIGTAYAYSVFLMLLVAGTFVFARRFSSRLI
jgi:iron(III) transport system permease protein